jgi:hypothetical protein
MAVLSSTSKEKFLIVDVSPSGTSALFLDFDERRELVFKKIATNIDLKKFLAVQAGSVFQKSWEGNYFFNSRRRLVVLADAELATTIPVPQVFKRDALLEDKPITLGEAEDWFARAMAKIFIKCRMEAQRRLGTSDINTVLVSQRIKRVTIDSRPVAEPIGRSGKKVSFVVELTFANRELAEALMPFFNAPGEFFFAEAAQARLAALARVKPLPINIVAARDDGKAALFVLQEAEQDFPVVYREPFLWDVHETIRSIAEDFGIVPTLAEEIYDQYAKGEVSDAMKKHFDVLAGPSSEKFLKALDNANLHGAVYLDMPRSLAHKVSHKRRHAAIEEVPAAALLEKFGFSTASDAPVSPHITLRYLAPFFELYFDNDRSELNELLRRKLHWLA